MFLRLVVYSGFSLCCTMESVEEEFFQNNLLFFIIFIFALYRISVSFGIRFCLCEALYVC